MRVDLASALAEASPIGVSRDSLERLDERVAAAHDRIREGRNAETFGYASLNLPTETDPASIRRTVDRLPAHDVVLAIGIGGSALGADTITAALGDESAVYTLDNVDPAQVREVLAGISLEETVVSVVSRSGTTAETLANFLVVRRAMIDAGLDWTERTLVTTGASGPLRELADDHDLPSLRVPEGVPGRFSALSPVGLAVPAMQGVDVEGVLAGARSAARDLSGSLFETPAYAYGAALFALDRRGAAIAPVMPYAEALEPFAEWYAQLLAESLGKERQGLTPVRALGATDQHSQLQLYRAGPLNKAITLLRPRERPDLPLPSADTEALAYLEGHAMGDLIDAEFDATAASLTAAGQPTIRVEIDAIDAESIGSLLYEMEAACILMGELFGVDTFTQPAVEWGKERARALLRGEDSLWDREALIVE
ncbi:MAG: glucose-6-phosphate isomerase [Halanaeroarchaeum sp.]